LGASKNRHNGSAGLDKANSLKHRRGHGAKHRERILLANKFKCQ
jgi:hypothetical protein